jgi:adenosine deaminase
MFPSMTEDVYRLAKNGIKAAFLDSRETKQYLDEFDAVTGNGRQ